MEEARLRESLLSALHSTARYQLQQEVYLPCSQGEARRGQGRRVRSLRMPRLLGLAVYMFPIVCVSFCYLCLRLSEGNVRAITLTTMSDDVYWRVCDD